MNIPVLRMMIFAKLPLISLTMVVLFSISLLYPQACVARRHNHLCKSSFCGNLNISYPFWLESQPPKCGSPLFELICNDNNQALLVVKHGKFHVLEISYVNRTARLVDASLERGNCSSVPRSSLYHYTENFYFRGNIAYLLACTTRVKTSSLYVDATPCSNISNNISSSSSSVSYLYLVDGKTPKTDFSESCIIEAEVPLPSSLRNISGMPVHDIYQHLLQGFQVEWYLPYDNIHLWELIILDILFELVQCGLDLGYYFFRYGFRNINDYQAGFEYGCLAAAGYISLRFLLGISILVAAITYKLRRRHLSMDEKIEEFLQSQNNFMPIRYSYSEIKKITQGFEHKLGQGGFGSVFKGQLRSGPLVAVKLLEKSKGNGQDFINEVATIGRIHHVNVAPLVGFCVEGSKQALVYDFMANGSLDKIIFGGENNNSLNWEQMFEIVLGVARGIDYLHQGCEMKILHFDIKPHNILLDEKFVPKISDFGLAKLHPANDSIVSLTAARGTIGYIAPELFYKSLGGISYKADVYSFGALLMEMVGRRKNWKLSVEQLSQIYFPSWIYDQFDQGEEMDLGNVTDEEKKLVRKVVIVAFWCIQMKPFNRPSMSKVLEMLESEVDLLEMPPRHSLFSLKMSSEEHVDEKGYMDKPIKFHDA